VNKDLRHTSYRWCDFY